jgi:hypothetical protein
LIVGAAATCGPLRRGPAEPPATIIFTNSALDPASVYVVGPGFEFSRIGTVLAGQTDTLTVPTGVALRGTLNVVARLFTSSDLAQTGPVSIREGEQYEVRLQPNSPLMSFLPAGS